MVLTYSLWCIRYHYDIYRIINQYDVPVINFNRDFNSLFFLFSLCVLVVFQHAHAFVEGLEQVKQELLLYFIILEVSFFAK